MAPTVLYLAGWGRSGSTLLAAALATAPGAFGAGEVRSLWARGVRDRRRCGCGEPVPECEVWSAVIEKAGVTDDSAAAIAALQATRLRTRHFPSALVRAIGSRRPPAELRAYLDEYRRVYDAIVDVTGARVIVDSSKSPIEPYYLLHAGVDLRVVHLVRDPRDVARSWSAPKPLLDYDEDASRADDEFRRFSPLGSTAMWTSWNGIISGLLAPATKGKSIRVRFEDFLDQPVATLEAIAAVADLDLAGAVQGRTVRLPVNHMVAGNPNRFTVGDVEVKERKRASSGLSTRDRALVTAAALPLLHRYGYTLSAARDT